MALPNTPLKLTSRMWKGTLSNVSMVFGDPQITYFPKKSSFMIVGRHETNNTAEDLIHRSFPDATIETLTICNELYFGSMKNPSAEEWEFEQQKYEMLTESPARIVLFRSGKVLVATGAGGFPPDDAESFLALFDECVKPNPLDPQFPFCLQ